MEILTKIPEGALELGSLIVAALSLIASVLLAIRSQRQQRRITELEAEELVRREELSSLRGTKEDVSAIAFRFLREGLPSDVHHKKEAISALVQAAIFEGSDRARGIVYGAIRKCYSENKDAIEALVSEIQNNMDRIDKIGLACAEYDPKSGRIRMSALRKILDDASAP